MFSWLSSMPQPTATVDLMKDQVRKIYSPLSGGQGANIFYTKDFQRQGVVFKKLKGSAAAFYGSPSSVQAGYPGQDDLNAFLREGKKKLLDPTGKSSFHVVMGNEAADLDSIASALAYAFFLKAAALVGSDSFPIPVVAIPRAELRLRTDVAWLLPNIGIDIDALVFADEIDMGDLFSKNQLHLVLVDHNVLKSSFSDVQNAIVEIIDHHVDEARYPWVKQQQIQKVGSCSTIVAERISESASELLANVALCRLMLAAIVSDTANFDPSSARFDPRDEIMAGLLVSGAAELGRNAFADLLTEKKFDQSSLTTEELLRRDYKQWSLGPGAEAVGGMKKGEVVQVGISSVGLSLAEVVGKDPTFAATAKSFMASRSLHLLVVMTLYLPPGSKKFKREIALISNLESLVSGLCFWLKNEKQGLNLKEISIKGVPSFTRAFTQGSLNSSRKQIQPLLAKYFSNDV